jgi:isopenicillin N synthase-like dioxygenase
MLKALHEHRFFLLTIEDQDVNDINQLYELMAEFFAHSVDYKRTHGKELLFGTANFVGYHLIEFDNEDNKRVKLVT